MDNNPYDTSDRQAPQQQRQQGFDHSLPDNVSWHEHNSQKLRPRVRTAPPGRLSKEQVLERVHSFKKYIVVASFLGFGALSTLIAGQIAAHTNTSSQPSIAPTIQDPSTSQGPSDSDGFFHHRGGFGFGSDNQSSAPHTRSGVS